MFILLRTRVFTLVRNEVFTFLRQGCSFYTGEGCSLCPVFPLGDHQTLKLSGKDTNGLFALIESLNDPGMQIPMHVHENEDEVFKVIEGELEITVGDRKTILKAGDLAFAPRNIPHSWRVVGERKAKVVLSVFPAGLEVMFEELSQLPAGPPDFQKVASIAKRYGISFIPV